MDRHRGARTTGVGMRGWDRGFRWGGGKRGVSWRRMKEGRRGGKRKKSGETMW